MRHRSTALLFLLGLLLGGCPDEPPDDDDSGPVDDDDAADDDDSAPDDDDSAPIDTDGDGFSAPDDCDDTDATVFPDAEELCDGIDNDCDGEVDNGVDEEGTDDLDSDGWTLCEGDCDDDEDLSFPGATEVCDSVDNDCDGVLGADEADADGDGSRICDGDCDDDDPLNEPDGVEICDGQDNDCDDLTDEEVEASSWYPDLDGDGFGGAIATVVCEAPAGMIAEPGDCDDDDATAYPGATEVCDGTDNDCADGVPADELDVDGDGLAACDGDCDDGEPTSFPGNNEVCDELDNDCDGLTDEGAIDVVPWFLDADGDGIGRSLSFPACAPPPGFVATDGDCDDLDPDTYPGAPELCDGVDNNCDGVIDDGLPDSDGDGVSDCADPDDDDDGLRDAWDVAPLDAAIARGPTSGLGGDGSAVLAADAVQDDLSFLVGGAGAGDAAFEVEDASPFDAGDEVIVLSLQGPDAGTWEAVFVAGVDGDEVTVEPPLVASYDAASTVLVQRIPHYVDLEVPAGLGLTALGGPDGGGGLVIARAQGTMTIAGTVSAEGAGFGGGAGVVGNTYDPFQGESWSGLGAQGVAAAHDGGGGAYPRRGDNGDSGGGASHGSAGTAGTAYGGEDVTEAGATYGDPELGTLFAGSGGGGGSPDTEGDGASAGNVTGDGGDGGGLVLLWAGALLDLQGTGAIIASGDDGEHAASADGEVGGGGAGAGGTLWLAAPTIVLDGSASALGGAGGSSAWHDGSPYGAAYGGDGGDGRVRLDVDALGGAPSPAAGFTVGYVE